MEECSYDDCHRPPRGGNTICKKHQFIEWRAGLGECSLGHCTRRIDAGGLCTTHYNRKRRGVPDWDAEIPQRFKNGGKCAHKDDCPEPAFSRGWCRLHYQRVFKLGYPDGGPVGLMKAASGEGSADGRGYRVITVGGKRYLEHRWVMEQTLGRPLESDEEVHHKNRIRDDNDRCPWCPSSTPPPVVLGVADDARLYCSACGWSGPKPNLELWVTPQPRGGRAEDLVAFYVGRYPELAEQALRRLRKAG